jgi:hypothetical protein
VRHLFESSEPTDNNQNEQEKEEQEHQPTGTEQADEGSSPGTVWTAARTDDSGLIANPFAKNERQQFIQEYYRTLLLPASTTTNIDQHPQPEQFFDQVRRAEEQHQGILTRPNLSIPVGNDFLYLPQ